MKIKNIMFSGFAAAIFAGVCASAQAASVNLASKKYVDTELALKQGILTPGDNINILDNVISATGLVTTEKLTEVQNALQDAIDAKQAAGEYADKEELETLKTTVETLKSGSADKETIETLKTTVETIAADYATKSELTEVEQRLQGAIDAIVVPTIPTLVSAFENDAGYITNDALTDLATKAEVNAKQAKLTAGDNITIDETTNVISATGFATQDALTNLQTTLEAAIEDKQAKGDYLTAESLTDLNNAVNALQSGKADATTVTALQNAINGLGETYATKEAMSAADEALQNAIDAINIPSLEGYVKSDDLATVATTGSYNDLTDTPTIPSLDGLATSEDLDTLRTTLEAAIADKQEKGDYLTAESLTELNNAVTALQSGKADAATVTALQNAIDGLGETYATKEAMSAADTALQNAINAIDLTPYAKTADVYSKTEADAKFLIMRDPNALGANLQWDEDGKLNTKGIATAEGLAELESKVASAVTEEELNSKGYLTAESELDGAKIKEGTVAKAALSQEVQDALDSGGGIKTVVTGTENGTIAVDGTDVPVQGLGSAAYTESSAYIAGPTPQMGTNFLQATCTNKKCSYSFISYDEVIDQIKADSGIGSI